MEQDEYVSRMQKAVEKAAVAISQLKDENFSLKEKLAAAEVELRRFKAAELSGIRATPSPPFPLTSRNESFRAKLNHF